MIRDMRDSPTRIFQEFVEAEYFPSTRLLDLPHSDNKLKEPEELHEYKSKFIENVRHSPIIFNQNNEEIRKSPSH